MENVAVCVDLIVDIFAALTEEDYEAVSRLAKKISKHEHIADLTKNDIRNNLQKSLFLPVNRSSLLEILRHQDDIADQAEDIAVLLTYKNLTMPEVIKEDFAVFLETNLDSFRMVRRIIQEIDELLQFSFGGSEANKVKSMIDNVAEYEHEADLIQRRLVKTLFATESDYSHGTFYLWMRIIDNVGSLSNSSEKLANRVRLTLDIQ